MLEEAQGEEQRVVSLVQRSFKKLQKAGVNISRDQWLNEAAQCEKSESFTCSKAIIRESLEHGFDALLEAYSDVSEKQRQKVEIWIENSRQYRSHGALRCARFLLDDAVERFPGTEALWNQKIKLEEETGTPETHAQALKSAVEKVEHNTPYILKYSRHLWKKMANSSGSLSILEQYYHQKKDSDPGFEDILLALQEMYRELRQFKSAESVLDKAMESANMSTEKVWLQAIMLQR